MGEEEDREEKDHYSNDQSAGFIVSYNVCVSVCVCEQV